MSVDNEVQAKLVAVFNPKFLELLANSFNLISAIYTFQLGDRGFDRLEQ